MPSTKLVSTPCGRKFFGVDGFGDILMTCIADAGLNDSHDHGWRFAWPWMEILNTHFGSSRDNGRLWESAFDALLLWVHMYLNNYEFYEFPLHPEYPRKNINEQDENFIEIASSSPKDRSY